MSRPLAGKIVRAPSKQGGGRWWVEVVEVSDDDLFVKVIGTGRASSAKPWWVQRAKCDLGKGKPL